jgi:hypothetical protein
MILEGFNIIIGVMTVQNQIVGQLMDVKLAKIWKEAVMG